MLGGMPLPGNSGHPSGVYSKVKIRLLPAVPFLLLGALASVSGDYISARQKFDLIESERLKPGSRLDLSAGELTAYADVEAPPGVRNPRIQLVSPEVVTGTALIDFGKLERAQGYQPGWLMSKLLDGERPVSVTARIQSAAGRARVDVQRVEIAGFEVDGRTLDFLIRNFLLALYPDAAVGRPFDLGHRIEKLDVQPKGVGVIVAR
jgi:hypothetical protein